MCDPTLPYIASALYSANEYYVHVIGQELTLKLALRQLAHQCQLAASTTFDRSRQVQLLAYILQVLRMHI
jgi:hypothetical protein